MDHHNPHTCLWCRNAPERCVYCRSELMQGVPTVLLTNDGETLAESYHLSCWLTYLRESLLKMVQRKG